MGIYDLLIHICTQQINNRDVQDFFIGNVLSIFPLKVDIGNGIILAEKDIVKTAHYIDMNILQGDQLILKYFEYFNGFMVLDKKVGG